MKEIERAPLDRRSEMDRRNVYDLDYFLTGGEERRMPNNRRAYKERRGDWLRIGKWLSINVQDINPVNF
jgi:hypothetical protein